MLDTVQGNTLCSGIKKLGFNVEISNYESYNMFVS